LPIFEDRWRARVLHDECTNFRQSPRWLKDLCAAVIPGVGAVDGSLAESH